MLQMEGIEKAYHRAPVVNGASFTVHAREAVALIGANGSGKSTLLRIAAGLLPPTAGEVKWRGGQGHARIGYVPERFPKLRFTPVEYLQAMGRMQGMRAEPLRARITELLRMFRMEEAQNRRIERFSKGMAQKVNLMQAVLKPPDLLILDEPLSGLDAESQHDLANWLKGWRMQGMALLFTCHEPLLLETVADRILLLHQGRIARDLGVEEWLEPRMRIDFTLPDGAGDALAALQHFGTVQEHGGALRIHVPREESDIALRVILASRGSIASAASCDNDRDLLAEAMKGSGEGGDPR